MISTASYSERINAASRRLAEADFVLIGAGAGLSAAVGLNYLDPELFARWYPHFRKLGVRTIWEGITTHWAPTGANHRRFWAFWAHHIKTIRYDAPAGAAYLDLHRLTAGREHFVISTNVDGQFLKAGFSPTRLFTPQGDYARFQCSAPCNNRLYDNRDLVQQMLDHADVQSVMVREADLPHCPSCGEYLERNLRRDGRFVESPWMAAQAAYSSFVSNSHAGKLVILELGVGFNTPSIIRWPFECNASNHPDATLVRVNLEDASVPREIEEKAIAFKTDAGQAIGDLLRARA
jgi:NAD-dependent SIR2 family protein deacetylase